MIDGQTATAEDQPRLRSQLAAVRDLMSHGGSWTLRELVDALAHWWDIHATEASVSARLRDLRKPQHGGWQVDRERVPGGHGLHRYRLRPPEDVQGVFWNRDESAP